MTIHQYLMAVGFGLVMLGVSFVILDFYLASLVGRLPPPEPRQKFSNQTQKAVIAHRMRLGGFILIGAGIFILLTTWFV
jgi:hypothetical protein